MADQQQLEHWAAALGLELRHRAGSPGELVPGVAIYIDRAHPERLSRIARLLRRGSREGCRRRISFHMS